MTHLTEETLNEYLDHALPPVARAEADAHLADCAVCAAELESLRVLFTEIESVPEAALERNLAPAVVAQISTSRVGVPRLVSWALVIQGIATLVVLASLSLLADFSALTLPPIPLTWPTLPPVPDVASWFMLPSFSFNFNPPVFLLVLLIVSAGLLWLVGNGLLLLLPRTTSLKRRSL